MELIDLRQPARLTFGYVWTNLSDTQKRLAAIAAFLGAISVFFFELDKALVALDQIVKT